MRIPWVQCSSPLDQYCIQPHIEATTMYHQLYMISSCILEHRSNYFLTLLRAWGFLPHPYTCHTLFVSHPLMGTILIQKQKATMPHPRKHHLSIENPMMFVSHMMRSYPHTLGGNFLTQKIPQWALHDLHHLKTSTYDPHLTPFEP